MLILRSVSVVVLRSGVCVDIEVGGLCLLRSVICVDIEVGGLW